MREPDDVSCQLFRRFLDHEKTNRADAVVLLGDIFDLMVGSYTEYIEKFQSVFEQLDRLAVEKKIYYFQGNHDFHLMDVFSKQNFFKNLHKIEISHCGRVLRFGSKSVYFEHGDDVEIGKSGYKIYKKIINSNLMAYIVKNVLDFKTVEYIGTRMSKMSRMRNDKKYASDSVNVDSVRECFRKSARRAALAKGYDIVILGHSHVKDFHRFSKGGLYLNNGYVVTERCFCFLDEEGEGTAPLVL